MSICEWGIIGYGIKISDLKLDFKEDALEDKIIDLLDDNEYLSYSVDGENNMYIFYAPEYPWSMRYSHKAITEDFIRKEIINFINDNLVNTKVSNEELVPNFYYISEVGWG